MESNPDHDKIMEIVGSRYLNLHRENYLHDQTEVKGFLSEIAVAAGTDQISGLISGNDWRVQLVGAYLSIFKSPTSIVQQLGGVL
ncbi:MAG: hypothetical protein N2C14_25930, partial [Planctomycetales bacterium]